MYTLAQAIEDSIDQTKTCIKSNILYRSKEALYLNDNNEIITLSDIAHKYSLLVENQPIKASFEAILNVLEKMYPEFI